MNLLSVDKPIINAHVLIACLVSVCCIAYFSQFSNIDLILADGYFDFVNQTFVYKEAWFAKDLMHGYVKKAIILFVISWILLVLIDAFFRLQLLSSFNRVRMRFVAIAAVLIPTVITSLKQVSGLDCPWHLQRYGGDAVYLKLFDALPADFKAGHCFPAGHASTGLWLAALCVFWFPHRPKTGWAVFFAGLSFGFLLGWVQQMRGAHFLSHTLWSLWIAGFIIILMLMVTQRYLTPSSLFQKAYLD